MANDLVTQARALLAQATPGPWRNGADPSHFDSPEVTDDKTMAYYVAHDGDAALIAASRQLLPALADRVEQLEQAAREVLAAYDAIYDGGHGGGRADRYLAAVRALRKVVG